MKSRFKKLSVTLIIGALFAVLLLQLPVAFSDDAKLSASDKAMAFMTNVVGLDVAKYSVQVRVSNTTDSGLFDTVVKYNLTSNGRKLDVLSLFRNNALVWCKLYPIEGAPLFTQAASMSSLDSAKTFLDRLQNYSTTSYFLAMRNMLNAVPDQKNTTITTDNVKQRISFGVGSEDIQWSYDSNGVENFYKAVVLTIRNGSFEFFCNNWDLYTIGNTNTEVSQMQAIQIAKQHATEQYSNSSERTFPDFTILEKNAMATLTMQDRGDYTLYPQWDVLLPLDKAYGAVTCIRVLIWADTGKVAFVNAVGNYGGIPTSQEPAKVSPQTSGAATYVGQSYILMVASTAAIIAIAACLFYKKKR